MAQSVPLDGAEISARSNARDDTRTFNEMGEVAQGYSNDESPQHGYDSTPQSRNSTAKEEMLTSSPYDQLDEAFDEDGNFTYAPNRRLYESAASRSDHVSPPDVLRPSATQALASYDPNTSG